MYGLEPPHSLPPPFCLARIFHFCVGGKPVVPTLYSFAYVHEALLTLLNCFGVGPNKSMLVSIRSFFAMSISVVINLRIAAALVLLDSQMNVFVLFGMGVIMALSLKLVVTEVHLFAFNPG
jgi:hypothetical protein